MRTCSYCGKEYPDDAVRCSIDGGILSESVPAAVVPPPVTNPVPRSFVPSERQLRVIEVTMVCGIALGGSLLISILSLFQTAIPSSRGSSQWGYGLLGEGMSLLLLWYVLLRRSKSFLDLGFIWKWTDIGWSILLCIGGYVAYCLAYYATYAVVYSAGLNPIGSRATSGSVADYFFGGGVGVITIIFLCVNPFFEELIARAYLMTEVKYLANSASAAVILSTLFQMTYHLYQGVPLAIAAGANFFLWSLYYAKTNRITPIILAHLYFDVGSTLVYVARH